MKLEWDMTADARDALGDKADEFVLSEARDVAVSNGIPHGEMHVHWHEWTADDIVAAQIRLGRTPRRVGDWHVTVRTHVQGNETRNT